MPRPTKGHRTPGSGKPKGWKAPKTLEKEAARAYQREMVIASLRAMTQAQIANALGIGHVYTRDKTGKFSKIEDQAHIDQLLTEGTEGEGYWIFSKDPSIQAFTDLMNRALDKPAEQIAVTGAEGGPLVFRWQE